MNTSKPDSVQQFVDNASAQRIIELSLVIKMMGEKLAEILQTPQKKIEEQFAVEAKKVLQEIQSTSTSQAEAESRLETYLQKFN